ARNDNSIRCMAIAMRRREWPRNKTSCVAKTRRSCRCVPSLLSSEKANWSKGNSRLCSADTSILTARAFGSLAQHSGAFVLMDFNGLITMTRKFEPVETVRCASAKAEHVAVKAIPEADASSRRETGCQFKGQWSVTGARYVLAQLFLVWRENADAS